MIGTLVTGGIISLLIVAVAAYLLLRTIRQTLARTQEQQQLSLQTYQAQQELWKSSLEKRLADAEYRFSARIQEFQTTQNAREVAENLRFDALINQYEATSAKARVEYELLQLPRVEDVPLPDQDQHDQEPSPLRTLNLQGVDLSGRDLSSRYLSHADLHKTKLAHSKLFMSDLSWANLADADLSDAELSAANLTHANLRGAILRGANLLVADLQDAVLIGADLRNIHGLSLDQVKTTLYDTTTLFDPEIANSLPRKMSSRQLERPAAPPRSEDTSRIPVLRKSQEFQTPTGDILIQYPTPALQQISLEDPSLSEKNSSQDLSPLTTSTTTTTNETLSVPLNTATVNTATKPDEKSSTIETSTTSNEASSPVDASIDLNTHNSPADALATNTAQDLSPADMDISPDDKGNTPEELPIPSVTETTPNGLHAPTSVISLPNDPALINSQETTHTSTSGLLSTPEELLQHKDLLVEQIKTPELADSN